MPLDEAVLASLPTMPLEFVEAILQEIEASKKSDSRVRLTRGRRLAQIGQHFHYVFHLDTIQHLAPDAPAEVILGDQRPVQASVVECNGLQITLACEKDLGRQVDRALLHSDLSMLMLRLIDRIVKRSEQGNPLGDRLLRGEFSGGLASESVEGRLTEGQRNAIRSGLGRDSTFIWGPPGTGKTQTIGALVAELVKRGRRTLIVSHTNTAVDGALLRAADLIEPKTMVEDGLVLRVGQPRKKTLQDNKNLLLSFQVERRVVHIQDELTLIRGDHEPLVGRAKELSNLVDILEWLEFALIEAEQIRRTASTVKRLRQEASEAKARWQEKRQEGTPCWELAKASEKLFMTAQNLPLKTRELAKVQRRISEVVARCESLLREIEDSKETLEKALEEDRLRTEIVGLPSEVRMQEMLQACVLQAKDHLAKERSFDAAVTEAVRLLKESQGVGRMLRLFKKLPDPEAQQRKVLQIQAERTRNSEVLDRLAERRLELEGDLARRAELENKIHEYRAVPFLHEVQAERHRLVEEANSAAAKLRTLNVLAERSEEEIRSTRESLDAFQQRHGDSVEDVHKRADLLRQESESLRRASSDAGKKLSLTESTWRQDIHDKAALMVEWGFLQNTVGSSEEAAQAIAEAIERKHRELAQENLSHRKQELSGVNDLIVVLQEKIAGLEDQLKNVEDAVIADALVVGATLTGAYLRETIQLHRFDTVIIDEASMAPIPAVWAVAGLADANTVVVGDFLQLPPIVKSEEEFAQRWLGRDVFAVAEVYDTERMEALKDHLMVLDEQFRMDPTISAVPRELVYKGEVRDGKKSEEDRAEERASLGTWFDIDQLPTAPLVLVDTSNLGAWVTTCSKGGNPSRLNLLSASLSCRLLGRGLREGRAKLEEGDEKRCLLVAPYRPHARLIEVMLHDRGLESEAQAGTAHAFQGGEADVVVLDLVNDEPHWKVGLFMPGLDEANKRLLNVALTRAKQRLFVVGDFDYLRRTGRRSFLGGVLVPYLLDNYPLVDARDLLREPFEVSSVVGYVSSEKILEALKQETDHSQCVVVYSPSIDLFGADDFLEACVRTHTGSQPIIVTKPSTDYPKKEQDPHRGLVESLRERGLIVLFKAGMREQMAVLDQSVWLLSGSLLDSADAALSAERLSGTRTVEEVADLFDTGKIVRAFQEGAYVCPICGQAMELREGTDGPFYWSCPEKGCYTRNADGPELQDGRFVCKHGCGPVEFGWTQTSKPIWRCCENPRHYLNVVCSHLRLPRMRELISQKDLPKVQGLVCSKDQSQSPGSTLSAPKPPPASRPVDLRSLFEKSPKEAAAEAIRQIVKAEGRIHRARLLDKGGRLLTNGAATRATKSVLDRALSGLHKAGEVRVEDDWTWICPL